MTGKKIRVHPPGALAPAPIMAEIRKSHGGASIIVSGVIAVEEICDTHISAAAHSGRIEIFGKSLSLTIFEGRSLEVSGIIEEVKLGYGRNRS